MLTISYMNNVGGTRYEFFWNVEDKYFPTIPETSVSVRVEASGAELQYIIDNFRNIAEAPHRTIVNWYGDDAMFIARNIG